VRDCNRAGEASRAYLFLKAVFRRTTIDRRDPASMVVIRAGAKSFGSPAAKAWLGFEIRWAFCFFKEGVLVDATVSRREWISFGSQGRNLRNTVAFQNEIETKEYPIEYLSFIGFKKLQIGDRMPVLIHPSLSYVVPAGRMGVIARPFIAGSLFWASAICATAFIR
jgi:hypothetical protein